MYGEHKSEIESDLGLTGLQFLAEPFKKIHSFLTSLLNLVLDAFTDIYTLYRQKLAG